MDRRDTKFFSELKRMNEDLISYLKETQDKSPYFDFSPTLEDYIKQFKEIDKKYPEKEERSFPSIGSSLPIPTNNTNLGGISFGTGTGLATTTTTTATTTLSSATPAPLFSFSGATTNNNNNNNTNALASNTTTTATTTMPFFTFSGANSIFSSPSINNAVTTNNAASTNNAANNTNNANSTNDDGSDDDAAPPEPNVDKYDEPDSRYSVKCKLYERIRSDEETKLELIGVGQLFIKSMEDPNKRQVIFRQDPDLRRVLLNEVLTPGNPVKPLPKAVQMMFPTVNGGVKNFIAKLKDETDAHKLEENLKF